MTSLPDLSQLDPDEQLRRNALGMRASVVPQQSTSANGPLIAPPSVAQGVNLPPVGPQPNKLGQDESQLEQLKSAPRFMGSQSGIASLKPQSTIGKIGKGILGGLDVIGSTLAPGLTARIPGTSMHHALLENQAAGNVAEDVAQQGKEAEAGEAKSRAHLADVEAKEKQDALPGMDEQAFAELIKKGIDPVEAYRQVKQAGQKPAVPNEFSEWLAQNPGKTVADFEKMKADARPHQGNDFEQYYQQYLHDNNLPDSARNRLMARTQYEAAGRKPEGDEGSWQMVEDANGKPVMFNSKTGATRAAPAGIAPKGTHAKAEQEYNKNQAPVQAALDYADSYLNSGAHTGSGDDTLMLQYFELAKPSTGFRLNQSEIQRQQQARSWREGLEARVRHATTGVWFSDEQRKQIVDSMHAIGKAKQEAMHGGGGGGKDLGPAPQGKPEGATGTMPDGTKVVVKGGRIVAQ